MQMILSEFAEPYRSFELGTLCTPTSICEPCNMSHSDRSRSPTRRSGSTLTRADLPGFPIWRGPMGQAIRTVSNPQQHQQWPGAYHMHASQTQVRPFSHSVPPPSQPFPPTPLTYRPPTFVTSTPHPPNIPASQPSQPCPPNQPCPPTPPQRNSPSHHSSGSPSGSTLGSASIPTCSTHARIYTFDLNEHWSLSGCQKINGLTLPKTIRSSAFSQKLDIEGCDPLSLPLAALLYQQANNHWIRKLASGREMYVIPTGDIAAVVFITELLKQFQSRGLDVDRIAMTKARQDGKLTDKNQNTKHIAQVVAQFIQSWIPVRATDPDSQHEITQLRQQLAELRQRVGDPAASTEATPASTPSAPSAALTPIQRALHGSNAPPASSFRTPVHADHPWVFEAMAVLTPATILASGLRDQMVQQPQTPTSADEHHSIQLGEGPILVAVSTGQRC